MEVNFAGKNIVVTGAGLGFGRAVCEKLYELGANIYAVSRSPGSLAELVKELPNIHTVSVDLADWNATRKALIILEGVPIHGLVNNAGVVETKPFCDMTEQDIDYMFGVNFKAQFNVTQIVTPLLVSGASIVNVSSLASSIGLPGFSVYSASKAALDSLNKSLAVELGPRNIRVNGVNPTAVLTRMGLSQFSDPNKSKILTDATPLGRLPELHEVVEPIVYLLSDLSSFINGHKLMIEGGYCAN